MGKIYRDGGRARVYENAKQESSTTHAGLTGQVFRGIIQGMGSANESRRHIMTPFLIGWAHTQNDPCIHFLFWNDAMNSR